jgi:predicted O-methyltransferase YrrM
VWEATARLERYEESGPMTLPQVQLADLVGDVELPLRPDDLRREDGGTDPFETLCIAAISVYLQPKCVMEIGTFRGHNTVLFARFAAPGAEIFTLDLDPKTVSGLKTEPMDGDLKYIQKPKIGEYVGQYVGTTRINQLVGDSMTYDFSPYHGRCDLVFVDAGHGYEFVKADTENAVKMLCPGGVILWHDYRPGCPGVVRAVQEAARNAPICQITGTSLAVCGLEKQVAARQSTPVREASGVA